MGDILSERSVTGEGVWYSNCHVHHLSYDCIGNEKYTDLIVICEECHTDLHDFINRMHRKGFSRPAVMARLKPYCLRKVVAVLRASGKVEELEDWKNEEDRLDRRRRAAGFA